VKDSSGKPAAQRGLETDSLTAALIVSDLNVLSADGTPK